MSFSADITRFCNKTRTSFNDVKRGVGISLFGAVIQDTPVATGALRANWQTTIGSPAVGTTEALDTSPNGATTKTEMTNVVNKSKATDTLILRNNLPYVGKIEYEGHSKIKAPQGMVRRNVIRFQQLLREQVRKHK